MVFLCFISFISSLPCSLFILRRFWIDFYWFLSMNDRRLHIYSRWFLGLSWVGRRCHFSLIIIIFFLSLCPSVFVSVHCFQKHSYQNTKRRAPRGKLFGVAAGLSETRRSTIEACARGRLAGLPPRSRTHGRKLGSGSTLSTPWRMHLKAKTNFPSTSPTFPLTMPLQQSSQYQIQNENHNHQHQP